MRNVYIGVPGQFSSSQSVESESNINKQMNLLARDMCVIID